MLTTRLTIKTIYPKMALLCEDPESVVGSYMYKGYRIQVSKFRESDGERVIRLYHKRRRKNQCVACGIKVNKTNPRTKRKYRLCEHHRKVIDNKV